MAHRKEGIEYSLKGDYKPKLYVKAERIAEKFAIMANYFAGKAQSIKHYQTEYMKGELPASKLKKFLKEEKSVKSAIRNIEQLVTGWVSIILLIGSIFLFSFSKDSITGYSIYTATSSLNYAVISGVFLLLTSIFLIIKTHK
jgi:hypothetical protein